MIRKMGRKSLEEKCFDILRAMKGKEVGHEWIISGFTVTFTDKKIKEVTRVVEI